MRSLLFYLIWVIVALYLVWVLPGIYLFFETRLFSDEYGYIFSEDVISDLKSTLGYDKSFVEGIKDFYLGIGENLSFMEDQMYSLL